MTAGVRAGQRTMGKLKIIQSMLIGVNQWLPLSPASGTISQGNNQNPVVGFDATGLSEGVYTGHITLNSNDADEGTIVIPCTMNVSNGFTVSTGCHFGWTVRWFGNGGHAGQLHSARSAFQYSSMELQRIRKPFSIPANMVDWILVDLRDATSAENAGSATRIARKAGIMLTDGSIVGTDGSSPLFFSGICYQ